MVVFQFVQLPHKRPQSRWLKQQKVISHNSRQFCSWGDLCLADSCFLHVPVRDSTLVSLSLFLRSQDVLEVTATHFSILAWEIPWTEEPVRLQSMGSQRVGHDLVTNT